ncbi:MAG: DUF6125 family protein [Desulfitobacteriaceae bacterium]
MLNTKNDLSRDEALELLTDLAKRWLAHDGLWFQSIEKTRGMDEAIHHDTEAWRKFTVIEAKRIMEFIGLPENGGLDSLERALNFRLYAFINQQEILRPNERTLILHMNDCRVQTARQRKGLADFPCKPVGEVEYSLFASSIDSRITTRCLCCPPDQHPTDYFCGWEFTLEN